MKSLLLKTHYTALVSHPARGAWIEMGVAYKLNQYRTVAPRKGCVD